MSDNEFNEFMIAFLIGAAIGAAIVLVNICALRATEHTEKTEDTEHGDSED